MSKKIPWDRSGSQVVVLVILECFLGTAVAAVEDPMLPDIETIDMSPARPAPWSPRHLSAPLVALFRGPDYIYGVREFSIETTPADGNVDLFYVRAGVQKRFEQAEAPVRVRIPSRIDSESRDSLTIRAFADGYFQKSLTFKVNGKIEDLVIDLDVLPNSLEALDYRYLAGRSSLSFISREALTFRIQKSDTGYVLMLSETSISSDANRTVEAIRGPRISEANARQLGKDLMVKLVLEETAQTMNLALRSRQAYDAPRAVHVFQVDLVDESAEASSIEHALNALSEVTPEAIQGCAGVFDSVLRAEFTSRELAQALMPRGSFSDRYLRAAMRRLGEISVDGAVDFEDGNRLRPSNPLELELALSNAATARGYLALLRSFVDENEKDPLSREQALRSLIAPKFSPSEFATRLASAQSAEDQCNRKGATF